MQWRQNRLKTINQILALMVMCGLFFNITRTTPGFAAKTLKALKVLLDDIDKPQWRIGYNFTHDCPPAVRQQEDELKESITAALQAWLQPLRQRYPNRQFTDDFLLVKLPDVAKCLDDHRALEGLDLRVTADCGGEGGSFATLAVGNTAPEICMRERDMDVDQLFVRILMHELGHALGLSDTYVRGELVSTGGLAFTMGKQPHSVMSSSFLPAIKSPFDLGKDDEYGLIWLYKYLHEDHPADDCFFLDYIRSERDGRCHHRYPLIFEAKHGISDTVTMILGGDPNVKLNARDSQGMTALHHAVRRTDSKMVKALLAQRDIKVNLLDQHRRTPAQLARVLRQVHLAKWIEEHPTAKHLPIPWSVAPAHSLTTTWGALKRAR